jgi:hypothetical protein
VRSADGEGGRKWELVKICPCATGPAPGPVTSPTTTPGFNQLTVTWTDPTTVPTLDHVNIQYTTDPTFATGVQQFTVAAGVQTHTLSTVADGTNYYVALQTVSATGATSQWTVVTEARPILKQLTVDVTGTQLSAVWNQAVTFNTGTVALTGTQASTATYSSGSGTTTLTYTLSQTIYQGWVEVASVPVNHVTDGTNLSVAMSGCPVTNNCTVAAVVFTSGAGNWTSTLTGTITWEIVAGGGGGANGTGGNSGGGGGGGEKRTGTLAVTLGNLYPYSVGAGGGAGADGGDTTFNTTLVAGKGKGAIGSSGGLTTTGSGGSAVAGSTGASGNIAPANGGNGGASGSGAGGGAGGTTPSGNGTAGTAPGGGGGGGASTAGAGAAGGAGRVTLTLP